MPSWVLSLIFYGAMAAFVLGGLWWWRNDGIADGKRDAVVEIQEVTEETNKAIRHIKKESKHETQSLDRAGIVRQLCDSGWVRNPDQCPD